MLPQCNVRRRACLLNSDKKQAGVPLRMRTTVLIFLLAASVAVHAQTTAKPAPTAKAGATTARSHSASSATKLPPGIPPAPGIAKTLFSLRVQDIKLGTGAPGEPQKLYTLKYTGWRAKDGVKFDSWADHPQPLKDSDGKPVMGADGKPKMGDPQPATFPVGIGRMIPGFDLGVQGMRVGGKRRIFIPWQLAYGTREIPEHGADHPGIPAKSDLIFDVELVKIEDMPMPANHPAMPGTGAAPGTAPKPAAPSAPASQPAPPPSSH